MGIDDEYTVADVTTPLSEEQLAYVDDLETFVILFGNEICYEAPVYEQISYYIEAAENAIGRKYMFRNAPVEQEDKEPLSLTLYREFCQETGTELDPSMLERHPYVQAHPEKYSFDE